MSTKTIADIDNIDQDAIDQTTLVGGNGVVLAVKDLGVTAAKIANATITTTQISGTAGITNAQLAGGIDYSKLSISNSIVNADVSTSASISREKLGFGASRSDGPVSGSVVGTTLTAIIDTATTSISALTQSAITVFNGYYTITDSSNSFAYMEAVVNVNASDILTTRAGGFVSGGSFIVPASSFNQFSRPHNFINVKISIRGLSATTTVTYTSITGTTYLI
jgi:hypothetical protein